MFIYKEHIHVFCFAAKSGQVWLDLVRINVGRY